MTPGRAIALTVSGAALLALTAVATAIQEPDNLDRFLAVVGAQGAVYLVAVWAVWNGRSSRRLVIGVATVAVLIRIPALAAPPFLSTDVYRYVWDGRVEAAGINPYRYVPTDPELAPLRDPDIFPEINRNNYARTIYPPVAEAIFLAVTRIGESVTGLKAAMVGFEVITFVLLVRLLVAEGLPVGRVVVYAWHPLPLWEFAGNGHIDAALIAFTVAALWAARQRRGWLAGLALAGAALTKLYPVILLPALYRRWDLALPAAFAAAVVVGYLPFIAAGWDVLGFLPGYAGEEGFDAAGSGFYLLSLLRQLPPLAVISGRVYMVGAALILAALAVLVMLPRDSTRSPFAGAAVLATAFTVLVSPHYPWYFTWLIVFACMIRSWALLWLTNACFLLYLIPVGSQLVRDNYRLAVESIIYGPFAALALADLWYRHYRTIRSS